MAGTQTRKFLQNQTYDAFYELVHELSLVVLSDISAIKSGVFIIPLLEPNNPPAIKHADALTQATDYANKALRECLFPGYENDNHHANIQRRWQPFDAGAWDSFYDEFSHVLADALDPITAHLQELGDTVQNAKSHDTLEAIFHQNYDRLSRLQYADEFESMLFG
jgi:hypothetical protein